MCCQNQGGGASGCPRILAPPAEFFLGAPVLSKVSNIVIAPFGSAPKSLVGGPKTNFPVQENLAPAEGENR